MFTLRMRVKGGCLSYRLLSVCENVSVGFSDKKRLRRYCQVNRRRMCSGHHAAYSVNAQLLNLPSSSLPHRDHQSLRLVVFSLSFELPRCRGNVSHAPRCSLLRNSSRMVSQDRPDLCQHLATAPAASRRSLALR